MRDLLHRILHFFASLKTAIPLLVVTIVVTVGASLFPDTSLYRSWWYLSLLGLNGLSLLFITVLHIPMILKRKGRNALIGVVTTHLGILVLIVGIIYGGVVGFRYSVRVIEGEMTVVPGLSFVVHLDELVIEEYPADQVSHLNPAVVPRKRQDSHLSLYRQGELWHRAVAAPGRPLKVEDVTLLPAIGDFGWYFELLVTDPRGREQMVPVKPWAPPLIEAGEQQLMAHALMDTGVLSAQVLTLSNGAVTPLGVVTRGQPLELNGYRISLGDTKRYTGLNIYSRPHAPILVIGCFAMLLGLLWHFYFRHRDGTAE